MDVKKAGCYKLYRCRSLLACDSGGTVYDTSQRFEASDGETLYNESQSESGQSENIIYIIDKDDEIKSSPLSEQTDVNHGYFDDDKFNNHEPSLNVNLRHIKEEDVAEDGDCKYYIVQCDDNDDDGAQNFTLDSDGFDGGDFEYYCDPIDPSSPVEDVSINSSNSDAVSKSIFIYNEEEVVQFDPLSNSSQETENSLDFQSDEAKASSPLNPEPTAKHTRKRKQSYTIKSSSFTELLDYDDSSDESLVSEVGKKKKMVLGKIEQREKYDPFENLKMSSILKKPHCAEKHTTFKNCTQESPTSTNDELSNASSSDEVFSSSEQSCQSTCSPHLPSHHHFLSIIGAFTRLNSDLTNADYLEYVQPREKIIESDMDKLLSPTIEVEISTIMKHCQINQNVQEAQGQADGNGNHVDLNQNSNSKMSASEAMEKQLISKSVYAIELGYQNVFNTSNECVIDEMLFDDSFTCKNLRLEVDLANIRGHPETKIPLALFNNPLKCVSSSSSLKDVKNEFGNCGRVVEDNSKKEVEEHQTNLHLANNQDNNYSNTSHSSFDAVANAVDVNANYTSTKFQASDTSIFEKQPIPSLKLRIKRVGHDDRYVVDDSSVRQHLQANNKVTSRFQKNPDSKYECSSCSEKFRTKRLLKSHISENHKGPYDMECEICHMKSKKSSAFKKHQPWCEKSTALKCEICEKVYCYKAVLQRHLNTHKNGF